MPRKPVHKALAMEVERPETAFELLGIEPLVFGEERRGRVREVGGEPFVV